MYHVRRQLVEQDQQQDVLEPGLNEEEQEQEQKQEEREQQVQEEKEQQGGGGEEEEEEEEDCPGGDPPPGRGPAPPGPSAEDAPDEGDIRTGRKSSKTTRKEVLEKSRGEKDRFGKKRLKSSTFFVQN